MIDADTQALRSLAIANCTSASGSLVGKLNGEVLPSEHLEARAPPDLTLQEESLSRGLTLELEKK